LSELADIAIEVNDLKKTYGKGVHKVEAVKGISLSVKKGEIFGFLGPNGAGKTTSLRMMVGLLEQDEGTVTIFGMDPKDVKNNNKLKKLFGVIPQEVSLYQELTVEENLWFMAKAYRIPKKTAEDRINNLIQKMGLEDKRKALVKNLSGGLKKRANLIMGLVHDPALILCDEPTPGLDPQSRLVVWDFIQNLPKEGKTVILTTHFMEEADRLSDRVAIIDNGKILVLNTPKKLKASIGEGDLLEFDLADDSEEHLQKMAELLKKFTTSKGLKVEDSYVTEKRIMVRALNVIPNLAQILNRIEKHGAVVENIAIRNTTLEDVFINFTGRALRN
jgi:ABC-2 type transport system ATP-binding protein